MLIKIINRTKFLAIAYAILNRCDALSKEVKMHLISSQFVPIPLYGMECFTLTVQQKALTVTLMCSAYRVYRLNRMISVREYLFYNSLHPVNFLLEERSYILLDSCKNSDVLLSMCRTYICCYFEPSSGCIDFLKSKSEIKYCMLLYAKIYCRIT